jgi:hypothetical protein
MKDAALDTAGETYPNIYTGTEMLLNEEQMYITRQKQETTALKGTNAVPVSPVISFFLSAKSFQYKIRAY